MTMTMNETTIAEYASRESLLGGYTPIYEDVTLPNGETVRIRNLPAGERDKYVLVSRNLKTGGQSLRGLETATARLIVLCVVDKNGNRLFSADDIPILSEQDPAITDAIYEAAARLCGLIEDNEETDEKNP